MPDALGLPQTSDEIHAYLQSALTPMDAGFVAQPDNAGLLPILWIEHGLFIRRMTQGDALCNWVFVNEQKETSQFVLDIHLRKPMVAAFHVVFPVAQWYAFLEGIAQSGAIWLVAGPTMKWRSLLDQVEEPELAFRSLERVCGGIVLTLHEGTQAMLRQRVQLWKKRYISKEGEKNR